MRIFRIGISGSYGGLNLGDEAILQSIVSQLRASVAAEITVFSRNAADTLRRHAVERVVPVRDIGRREARAEVERLDALILGGGGILYDREAATYLREVQIANDLGIPVLVYAVSAGPLEKASNRELVCEALNQAAVITVRDRQGRQLLEDIGVHNDIHLAADPALLLEPEPIRPGTLEAVRLDENRRLVGFSVREPGPAAPDIDVTHYHRLLANAADFMVDRLDADIVFVPMERYRNDMQHSHAVVSQMQNAQHATVLKPELSPGQVLTLVGHFEFVVGMRLHFLLFAAHRGVPFVALPYSSKVSGLLQDLDMQAPVLHDVSVGRLIANIDRSWDLRQSLRERISKRMPALQERARITNALLVDMLNHRAAA